MPDQERKFLTVQEVAKNLRVSTMTIYRLIEAGELSATRIGRSYRISRANINAYLSAHSTSNSA